MRTFENPAKAPEPRFVDADAAAARYGFSKRHWLRLVDSGKAPAPTRFGRLVRWCLTSLQTWENDGCKPIRTVKTKGGAAW